MDRYWPIRPEYHDTSRRRQLEYVPSEHGRRIRYEPEYVSDDLCLAQWQWAFDDNEEYPQQVGAARARARAHTHTHHTILLP